MVLNQKLTLIKVSSLSFVIDIPKSYLYQYSHLLFHKNSMYLSEEVIKLGVSFSHKSYLITT